MEEISGLHYLLVVDVGGTNARFRLVERSINDSSCRSVILEKTYKCKDYKRIQDIFTEFLGNVDSTTNEDIVVSKLIKVCTIAAAGSINDHKVKIVSNYQWDIIDAEELKLDLEFSVNDLEASGYSVSVINPKTSLYCIVLNEGDNIKNGNKLILGTGTGFGSVIITYNKTEDDYNVHSGEGGYTEYVATTISDLKLRNFTIDFYKTYKDITLNRIGTASLTRGPALPIMYEFFKTEFQDLEVVCKPDSTSKIALPEDIIHNALTNKDPLCLKVINQFVKHLAIVAGNLALITLSYGGIYICGGVAVALKDYLNSEESNFIKILSTKGQFSKLIMSMPVYLITNEIGLDGAEQYCLQALKNHYED